MLLHGQKIPRVKVYKYLGVPHVANGIDWSLYCDLITSKIAGLINALHFRKKTWNYQTRLIIYKTFIRPAGEYCLPLLTNWIARDKNGRSIHQQKLKTCHLTGLNWIFDSKTPRALLELISGLGSFENRVLQLEGSLSQHLQLLDSENPLKLHYSRNLLSYNTNYILHPCFKNEEFSKWKNQKVRDPLGVTFSTSCRQQDREYLLSSAGILQHYVLPSASSFSIKDSLITRTLAESEKMLAWRSNRSFTRATCPHCLQKFTRAHLVRCNLYDKLGERYMSILISDSFKKDINKVKEALEKYKKGSLSHYSIFDFFLNHKKYSEFNELYSSVWSLLYGDKDSK